MEVIYKTRLTFGDGNIWQMEQGGKLLWVMPEDENLMLRPNAKAYAVAGTALRINGTVSSVTVMATTPMYGDRTILEKLGKIILTV